MTKAGLRRLSPLMVGAAFLLVGGVLSWEWESVAALRRAGLVATACAALVTSGALVLALRVGEPVAGAAGAASPLPGPSAGRMGPADPAGGTTAGDTPPSAASPVAAPDAGPAQRGDSRERAAPGPGRAGYRLHVGQRLGDRYEVLDVLGRGGMGLVYRAHDRELGGDVVIKTVRPELIEDDAAIAERFRREIRLSRLITHPNVVRTYEYGEADGFLFVSMEFIDGVALRDVLASRGRLSPASTLAVGRQLFGALAAAHASGVVHRDIKPENLLLTADGTLKVTDFGIARLTDQDSTLTEAGTVIGTPVYMAPEQILGEAVTDRADIYAGGVVLFECLTGRVPFEARSPVAMVAKLLSDPPPSVAALAPETSPAVAALVGQLLAKEPGSRPSAERVEEELHQVT